ncbi:MAG: phosphopantothenoylcysteine decarboxylase domain-containing protein [Planctomycetota bacterium]|jgi:phosphopantothenoylcysteine synthetase/decarboxylase
MHFLITAGGTREYIDPVRFISNASSGKMGYALARVAIKAGHKVTLITAPTNLRPPLQAKIVNVETCADMFTAVKKYFDKCDCLIMAAAVSDYTPAVTSKTKIKKSDKALAIRLKPTTDILKWAGENKVKGKKSKRESKIVVGFALEDKNIQRSAEKKLNDKNIDMIIANTPAAIGTEKSTVWIKTSVSDWFSFEDAAKTTLSGRIIKLVEDLR